MPSFQHAAQQIQNKVTPHKMLQHKMLQHPSNAGIPAASCNQHDNGHGYI